MEYFPRLAIVSLVMSVAVGAVPPWPAAALVGAVAAAWPELRGRD